MSYRCLKNKRSSYIVFTFWLRDCFLRILCVLQYDLRKTLHGLRDKVTAWKQHYNFGITYKAISSSLKLPRGSAVGSFCDCVRLAKLLMMDLCGNQNWHHAIAVSAFIHTSCRQFIFAIQEIAYSYTSVSPHCSFAHHVVVRCDGWGDRWGCLER